MVSASKSLLPRSVPVVLFRIKTLYASPLHHIDLFLYASLFAHKLPFYAEAIILNLIDVTCVRIYLILYTIAVVSHDWFIILAA